MKKRKNLIKEVLEEIEQEAKEHEAKYGYDDMPDEEDDENADFRFRMEGDRE